MQIELKISMAATKEVEPRTNYFTPAEECVENIDVQLYIPSDSKTSTSESALIHIGEIHLTDLKLSSLMNAQTPLADIVDDHPTIDDEVLLLESEEIDEYVMETFGDTLPLDRLLYINYIGLKDEYRGRGYGISALDRALRVLGSSATGVAVSPIALQNNDFLTNYEAAESLSLPDNDKEADTKVRRQFSKLGFLPVRGTENIMMRNTHFIANIRKPKH